MTESTICWSCKRACGGCAWSKKFEPVEGWNAEETLVKNWKYWKRRDGVKMSKPEYTKSYVVKSCPLYQRERRFVND